jgi:glycosyltransferase 2 family protein
MRRRYHLGMLLVGVALTGWILWTVGLATLASDLSMIGTRVLVFIALYLFAQLAYMVGWWMVMDSELRACGFLKLFGIYLAGDTINYLVPSGNLGGEPVKAYLLREELGFGRALTSIVIHKHAELVAQWVLLAGGLAICLTYFELPSLVTVANTVIVGGLGGSLLLMTWVLKSGTISPILRRLADWRLLASYLQTQQPAADALATRIRAFYEDHWRWFLVATSWCLVGWCGGLLETYLVLRILSPAEGWSTAVAIETMVLAFNMVFVFVPARLGSAEGVRAGVFLLVGLPAAEGVAYGVIRRARELAWILPGLVILWKRHLGWFTQRGSRTDQAWLA